MAKEELLELDGIVDEVLPDSKYRVTLENGVVVGAYASAACKNHIRILAGDRVTLELSVYDLTKGRINFRHKDATRVRRAPANRAVKRQRLARARSTASPIESRPADEAGRTGWTTHRVPSASRRRHRHAAAANTAFTAARAQRSGGRVPQEILDDHRDIRRTCLHRVMPAIRYRHEPRVRMPREEGRLHRRGVGGSLSPTITRKRVSAADVVDDIRAGQHVEIRERQSGATRARFCAVSRRPSAPTIPVTNRTSRRNASSSTVVSVVGA